MACGESWRSAHRNLSISLLFLIDKQAPDKPRILLASVSGHTMGPLVPVMQICSALHHGISVSWDNVIPFPLEMFA